MLNTIHSFFSSFSNNDTPENVTAESTETFEKIRNQTKNNSDSNNPLALTPRIGCEVVRTICGNGGGSNGGGGNSNDGEREPVPVPVRTDD